MYAAYGNSMRTCAEDLIKFGTTISTTESILGTLDQVMALHCVISWLYIATTSIHTGGHVCVGTDMPMVTCPRALILPWPNVMKMPLCYVRSTCSLSRETGLVPVLGRGWVKYAYSEIW